MKYRLTPLHFLAAYLFIISGYYFVILDTETAELGGLFPYIYGFIGICILSLDLLVQYIFFKRKSLLYFIETLILISIVVWYLTYFGLELL